VNFVAVLDERRDQTGGRLLDPAVEDERPRDDEEFQGSLTRLFLQSAAR
jgi:hypothetical protein